MAREVKSAQATIILLILLDEFSNNFLKIVNSVLS